jgi:hypothetical protein
VTPAENPEGSARVFKRIEGKTIWNGVAKQLAPDGEFIIWEFYGDPESGTTAKPISGSERWKGIKGEPKSNHGWETNCPKYRSILPKANKVGTGHL